MAKKRTKNGAVVIARTQAFESKKEVLADARP